jgi:hypothetical protein
VVVAAEGTNKAAVGAVPWVAMLLKEPPPEEKRDVYQAPKILPSHLLSFFGVTLLHSRAPL